MRLTAGKPLGMDDEDGGGGDLDHPCHSKTEQVLAKSETLCLPQTVDALRETTARPAGRRATAQ